MDAFAVTATTVMTDIPLSSKTWESTILPEEWFEFIASRPSRTSRPSVIILRPANPQTIWPYVYAGDTLTFQCENGTATIERQVKNTQWYPSLRELFTDTKLDLDLHGPMVPSRPSSRNYFTILHSAFVDDDDDLITSMIAKYREVIPSSTENLTQFVIGQLPADEGGGVQYGWKTIGISVIYL